VRAIDLFLRGLPAIEMTPVNPTPAKKPDPSKKPDFEHSLARLEEIVRKLESANLSLDEAMKLFEEGVQLSRDCQKHLEQAEGKVELLLKKAGGELVAEPFDPESEEQS
jgi:exodeoxyribonuclease VII small subunit